MTDAEQGKFYRPINELDIPIYLDTEVKEYFAKILAEKKDNISINELINSLLKKDIQI